MVQVLLAVRVLLAPQAQRVPYRTPQLMVVISLLVDRLAQVAVAAMVAAAAAAAAAAAHAHRMVLM